MEHRLFFLVGDLAANILTGAIAGWLAWLIVAPGWNMWFAMFPAMLIGMLVGLVLFFPLSILLGAMEVMIPLMLSGMISGMVVGMWSAMSATESAVAVSVGGLCGLAGILVIWIYNIFLLGIRKRHD